MLKDAAWGKLDTMTPAGRAMFGMLGVFGEFERAMIVARVKSGIERAKAEQAMGKVRRDAQGRRKQAIGRSRIAEGTEQAIKDGLAAGGSSTVQRVKREMVAVA